MPRRGFKKLIDATVDIQRAERCGFPEVIFCQGKTLPQIKRIARTIFQTHHCLLATRADKKAYQAIKSVIPGAIYHKRARCVTAGSR